MARKHDDAKTAEAQDENRLVDTEQGGETEDLVDQAGEGDEAGEVDDGSSEPAMMLGTKRDRVMRAIWRRVKQSTLGEADQKALASDIEQVVREIIREVNHDIAGHGHPAITVSVKDPAKKSDKGLIEAKLQTPFTDQAWEFLAHLSRCVVVDVDAETFMGAKPAFILKDQPGLFPDGTETPAEKAKREEIERENVERAESEARARQFTECEPPAPRTGAPTVDNDTGEILDEEPKLPRTRGRRALSAPTDA